MPADRLSIAIAFWLALFSLGAPAAYSQDARDREIRSALAARLGTRAIEIDRTRLKGRAQIDAIIEEAKRSGDATQLATHLGLRTRTSQYDFVKTPTIDPLDYRSILKWLVSRDPPCDSRPCAPHTLFNPVPSVDPKAYVECIVEALDSQFLAKRNELKSLSNRVQTATFSALLRLDYSSLSTGFFRSYCRSGSSVKTVAPIQLRVDWSKQCTQDKEEGALYQPSVAAILFKAGKAGQIAFCTGTLIAPNAILTAAHCICATQARGDSQGQFFSSALGCAEGTFISQGRITSTLDPASLSIFLQHSGIHEIERVVLHRRYSWISSLPHSDLAILILKTPVAGIEPAALDTQGLARRSDVSIGRSVGYGWSNPLDAQGRPTTPFKIVPLTGIKFTSRILPTGCYPLEAYHRLVCWDYRTRVGLEEAGSTCHGDSGGPLFLPFNKTWHLAGVTTAGNGCTPGARAYSVEVFSHAAWIKRVLASFPTAKATATRVKPEQVGCRLCQNCGDINVVGSDISNSNPPPIQNIAIPRKKRKLLVSANCTAGLHEWRIALSKWKKETGRHESQDICAAQKRSSFASCEAAVQEGEKWVAEIKGLPLHDCQIVATAFE